MIKLLIQLSLVGFASISYAGLREKFSKSYTLETLTKGTRIDDLKTLSKRLQERLMHALDERANFDDVNFHKEVYREDFLNAAGKKETVYKVVSRGDVDLGNEDFFVLEIFDKNGKHIGGCYTKVDKHSELKSDEF